MMDETNLTLQSNSAETTPESPATNEQLRIQIATMRKTLSSLQSAIAELQGQLEKVQSAQPPNETWESRRAILTALNRHSSPTVDVATGTVTKANIGICETCRQLAAADAQFPPDPTSRPHTKKLTLVCRTEVKFQPDLVITACNLHQPLLDTPTNPPKSNDSSQPLMN
jgi:TolA-binding protein